MIPDAMDEVAALGRVTHLGIGAHQDDLEFMALPAILECFQREDRWFGGVTVTDGGGSARSGRYAAYSDDDMKTVRHREQETAAIVGQYAFIAQLDYASSAVKKTKTDALEEDIATLLKATRPTTVYTHNPADKHDTHVAVMAAVLRAIRRCSPVERPKHLLGFEAWRSLDWMLDCEKVVQDVSAHDNLSRALGGIFDSQIAGGKRYDEALDGRRRSNATMLESHATDAMEQACFAIDMTPLIENDSLDVETFIQAAIRRFAEDVSGRLRKFV